MLLIPLISFVYLARSEVPVYVIPGNHDPLVPGSVWDHPVWASTQNVFVLREEVPINIPGGILYPCPVFEKHSGKDPTLWIPDSGEEIRIGMAHGTVEGIPTEEIDYPIPRDAAAQKRLDYLALGHWHSFAYYPQSDRAVHMAYSGTHEPTKFGERDSGNVLIVEIPHSGEVPSITPIQTGKLQWRIITKEIRDAGDMSRIRDETNAGFVQLHKEQSPQAYEVACRDYFPRANCRLIAIAPRKITLSVAGPPSESAGYSFSGYFDILNVEKWTAHRISIWDAGESSAYNE